MGYSYQQMMQQPNLPQRGANDTVLCNDGTYSITNGIAPPCDGVGVKNQTTLLPFSPVVNISPEEKFYESLGLKYRGGYGATVKAKGRLLVAVALVAGYFAYKKFKK